MRRFVWIALIAAALSTASCRTSVKPGGAGTPPPGQRDFRPVRYLSSIHRVEGRNADLYGNHSYAVWVGPEVVAFKREVAIEQGKGIDPRAELDAVAISEDYIVIECHIESAFADTSIAYDAVAFRNVDVYLETPGGERRRPVQIIVGTPVEEEPVGALMRYRRTNLAVFPRRDLWVGRKTVDRKDPYARLVLEGFDGKFQFEWPGAPIEQPYSWVPTEEESKHLAVMGIKEFATRVHRLAHRLD
ncbi:MAG: hypothetical protein GY851_32125 [bacterium]|nr:hypothetical protein [bacterium]